VYLPRDPQSSAAVRRGTATSNPVLDPETARMILQRLKSGTG
jgi:hypothetical protein